MGKKQTDRMWRLAEAEEKLSKWEAVFGHLGTPDEVGNEWLALTDRLKKVEAANKEWLEKTEWVQAEINNWTLPMRYLGQHRADVIRAEVDALRARIEAMERLEQIEAAAQNLVKMKGRHNTEIAYQRLVAALDKSK